MFEEQTFFDQSMKNDQITYDEIQKTATGEGGFLLDYLYLKKNYMLIAINLSKQHAFDADPEAIQQINFTGNLERDENTQMFLITEEAKETASDFSKGTVRVFSFFFFFSLI